MVKGLVQLDNFISRRLQREYALLVSVIVLLMAVVMLAVMFATEDGGRTAFGPGLGGDFAGPYVAGWLYNHEEPAAAYDRLRHQQTYHQLFPRLAPGEELPFMGAPFLLLPFTLLARLPYAWAFLAWIVIALILYCAGFRQLWRTLSSLPQRNYRVALLLTLSFAPVAIESIVGGQTTAFGFFCLALAISWERRGRALLSGVVLAFCSYKLMFLALIVPMLLVTRRFKQLAGLALGGLLAAGLSVLLVGVQGCLNYVNLLRYLSAQASGATTGLKQYKYVDINSFARLLVGPNVYLRWALAGAVLCAVLPFLLRLWRRAERALVWAATITWTVVLNVYWGLYDAAVIALAVLLTTEVLLAVQTELPKAYKYLLLTLYVLPWITQDAAQRFGVQVFTLGLIGLGIYQWRLQKEVNPVPTASLLAQQT